MQKIVLGKDIRKLDEIYTQSFEVSSIDLMERAGSKFTEWLLANNCKGKSAAYTIVCGTGNNGGDGLVIARQLRQKGFQVKLIVVGDPSLGSEDFMYNFRLVSDVEIVSNEDAFSTGDICSDSVVDALFGVGLNRPLAGLYAKAVEWINQLGIPVFSVDIPSGLPADSLVDGPVVRATATFSFQFPKFALLVPAHADYVGDLHVSSIGMEGVDYELFEGKRFFLQAHDIPKLHKQFGRFAHKGSFGKVLLIVGSYGKMGAAQLTSLAALRTGSGLVSAFVPGCGVDTLQTALPELMVEASTGFHAVSVPLPELSRFDAVAIGPGLGTGTSSLQVLSSLLENFSGPKVLDADALNLLALNPYLANRISGSILTPHLVEFQRLVGPCRDHFDRIAKGTEYAAAHQCIVVLKGANSAVLLPDGSQIFNSSGNQYMATGGSGDVLTGIMTSFLGQGYSPANAALCGVFHHGLAGELASVSRRRGTIASDIASAIPETFVKLNIK